MMMSLFLKIVLLYAEVSFFLCNLWKKILTEAEAIPVSFQLKYSAKNNEEKVSDVRLWRFGVLIFL